jgi:hypothetical protein
MLRHSSSGQPLAEPKLLITAHASYVLSTTLDMADVRVGFQDTFNIARHATIIIGCTIILIFVKYVC